jgi:glycine/serine hydroxymethyltransferase
MKKVLLLILLIPILSFSQSQIQGIVIDSKTNKPLPFASVVTNTNFGSLSGVDGKFSIQTKNPFNKITISYIG